MRKVDAQRTSETDTALDGREAEPPQSEDGSVASADGRDVEEHEIPDVVRLAHDLGARVAELCHELHQAKKRIEALEHTLADRDNQIQSLHRMLILLEPSPVAAPEVAGTQAATQGKDAEAPESEIAETPESEVTRDDTCNAAEEPATEVEGDTGNDAEEPEQSPLDAADLVAKAMKSQQMDHATDQAELEGHLSELAQWTARIDALRNELGPAVQRAAADLKECGEAFQSLPTNLQTTLRGRHEGLELIGKMIHRLPDQLPKLGNPPERSLPFLTEDAWTDLLSSETSRDSADQRTRETLEDMSSKRYRVLSQTRRIVDTNRQSLLHFLKTQVLPVIDGIEDGEKHSRELVECLKTTDSKSERRLEIWYRTYVNLHLELLDVLGHIKVQPLEAYRGMQVDYARQEPFAIEADPELETEDVKEVTRTGYEFTTDENGEAFVLRPAQVIVVKNTKESNLA